MEQHNYYLIVLGSLKKYGVVQIETTVYGKENDGAESADGDLKQPSHSHDVLPFSGPVDEADAGQTETCGNGREWAWTAEGQLDQVV